MTHSAAVINHGLACCRTAVDWAGSLVAVVASHSAAVAAIGLNEAAPIKDEAVKFQRTIC
jgi:hypothetical protein